MAMAENAKRPLKMGQNVHRFQVRTPICHIVPVSRAYGGGAKYFFSGPKRPPRKDHKRFRNISLCFRTLRVGICKKTRSFEGSSATSSNILFKASVLVGAGYDLIGGHTEISFQLGSCKQASHSMPCHLWRGQN